MFPLTSLLSFALIAFAMALTPGPNMLYLVSRSLTQGAHAALISLAGTATGFLFYMAAAALGLSAIAMTVPFLYDTVRLVGCVYLLFLAWQALKPGGKSAFDLSTLPPASPRRLYAMGLLTNLLNPKVAILYLSLLPQFIHPEQGHVLTQSLILGAFQIAISLTVNGVLVLLAGHLAALLRRRPLWMLAQRWLMGTVLAGLAIRLALDSRR